MIRSFDIETFSKNNKLIPYCLCYLIDKNNIISFYGLDCINNFIEYLFENDDTVVFAHNLTFDGSLILQNMNNNFKINGIFFKGNIYCIEITNYIKKIKFLCSYKFFPYPLSIAWSIIETTKKAHINHMEINEDNFMSKKDDIIEYCKIDCIIVYEIMSKFKIITSSIDSNILDYAYSISGLSLKLFNKIYNNYDVKINLDVDTDAIFRQSYFGGRCEVFGNPESCDLIYHYDYSGMYAQIMTEEFCFGEFEIIENPDKIEKDGFYYISVYSLMDIPILPHKSKNDSKLVFTNGHFSGLYWCEEINLFVENGGIIEKIHYKIKFKEKKKIFKNFVETFTEKRKENKSSNVICKLIVNSLYGRLGMSEKTNETIILSKSRYKKWCKSNEKNIIKENLINNYYIISYYKFKKNKEINSNVSLASMITSKARIKLYKGYLDVIKNNGRLLYSDTDSIFVAFKKNVDNKKFGDVIFDTSKKDTKIKEAVFALPKAYILKYYDNSINCKIKGVSKPNFTIEEFKNLFENKSTTKINLNILKKSNYIVTPLNIIKMINLNNYNKRVFNENLTNTRALFKKKNNEYT